MGEVSARIHLLPKDDELGWTYSKWTIDYGKGQAPMTEEITIKCAETSQRFMSKEEATSEAQARIKCKIDQECHNYPAEKIKWEIKETD